MASGALEALSAKALAGVGKVDVVELAQRWVKIPSPSGEELAVVEDAEGFFQAQGLATKRVAAVVGRPNLIVELDSGSPGPVIALNGHLDTVPVPNGYTVDPFGAKVEGGRLYGLGSLDMKGACAAMAVSFLAVRATLPELKGKLQLQLVVDEETGGSVGARHLVSEIKAGNLERPDAVLNSEYTGLKIMTAERGSFKLGVRIRGRATHTATARVDGRNAIYYAAKAIQALEGDLSNFDPLVGYPVISINQVKGGRFASQVADECEFIVDRRLVTTESKVGVEAEIAAKIAATIGDVDGVSFELFPQFDAYGTERFNAPCVTDRGGRYVQEFLAAHQKRFGGDESPWFLDWFGVTDGRLFRYEDIPTLSYGPSGLNAHAPDEWVDIDSLWHQTVVYVDAIHRILGA